MSRYYFVVFASVVCAALILKTVSLLPGFVIYCYSTVINFIAFLLIAKFTFKFTKILLLGNKVQPHNRAVFISGCDHGFGHLLAKQLDFKGFHVFASCYDPSGVGAAELKKYCSDRLKILKLDVRKDGDVKEAVDFVNQHLESCDLWAIVNNAGILRGTSTDFSDLRDFQDCMDVNLFGTVRVTKAFLPLLKQSRGRIINVTSLGGKLTVPFLTPYIVSKFADVGFSECLRQELNVWGIRVISIEPELFRTPIADWNLVEQLMDLTFYYLSDDIKAEYGDKYFKTFKNIALKYSLSSSPKVQNVVRDLEFAISLEYPDAVYRPCRNVATYVFLSCFEMMPIFVRDFVVKLMLYFLGSPVPMRAVVND